MQPDLAEPTLDNPNQQYSILAKPIKKLENSVLINPPSIGTTVKMPTLRNNFKVYELDDQGRRKNELKITVIKEKGFFSTSESSSPLFEIEVESFRNKSSGS